MVDRSSYGRGHKTDRRIERASEPIISDNYRQAILKFDKLLRRERNLARATVYMYADKGEIWCGIVLHGFTVA